MSSSFARSLAVLALAALLTACADDALPTPPPEPPAAPATVSLEPSQLRLAPGTADTLSAQPLDEEGVALDAPITWSSSDTSVVSVSEEGVVDALRRGTATVTAESRGTTASAEVEVFCEVDITWSPRVALDVGKTFQLAAIVDCGPDDSLVWRSRDTSRVTVTQSGLVEAIAHGDVWIVAEAKVDPTSADSIVVQSQAWGRIVPSSPTVSVGDTVRFRLDTGDPMDWRVWDPAIAEHIGNGVVVAFAPGQTIVHAVSQDNRNVQATTTLYVRER